MSDPYVYPESSVIKNKFDIRDRHKLEAVERRMAQDAASKPVNNFDVSYKGFKAIHRHLFGEVYEWAGYSRGEETPFGLEKITPMINLSKGDTAFAPPTFLERIAPKYFEETKVELDKSQSNQSLTEDRFAQVAAIHIADLNHAHPFREGNGRTMRVYLDNLAKAYGFDLQSQAFDKDKWMDASIKTFSEGHQAMKRLILDNLSKSKDQAKETGREEIVAEKTMEEAGRKYAKDNGLEFTKLKPNTKGTAQLINLYRVDGQDFALIQNEKYVGYVKVDKALNVSKGQAVSLSPSKGNSVVIQQIERNIYKSQPKDIERER